MNSLLIAGQISLLRDLPPREHGRVTTEAADVSRSWLRVVIRMRAGAGLLVVRTMKRLRPPRRDVLSRQEKHWLREEKKRRAELCRIWRSSRRCAW